MKHIEINDDYTMTIVLTNNSEVHLKNVSLDDKWITGKDENGEIVSINIDKVLYYKQHAN